MWLPLHLEHTLGLPRGLAGYLPLLFELGGLLGSPALGFVADWFVWSRVEYRSAHS